MKVLFKTVAGIFPDMETVWIRAVVVEQTGNGYMLRYDDAPNSKPFFVGKEYVKSIGA